MQTVKAAWYVVAQCLIKTLRDTKVHLSCVEPAIENFRRSNIVFAFQVFSYCCAQCLIERQRVAFLGSPKFNTMGMILGRIGRPFRGEMARTYFIEVMA